MSGDRRHSGTGDAAGTPTNWAGNLTYRAGRIHRPSSVDQLRELVAGSRRIRALGSRHSFSEVADTTGDLVDLAGLPPTVEIDPVAGTVRVAAGLRYAELVGHLDRAGFALANLASLPHISVAGACATGTHGSGTGIGCLATSVSGLELVTADGGLLTLRRDDPDLAGAVVGLGALGVVTHLTLDLVPAFALRQTVYEGLSLSTVTGDFDRIMADAYSVCLFTDWRSEVFTQAWVNRLADEPGPGTDWFGARPADGPRHPVGLDPVSCTEQLGTPGPWYGRLPHFRPEHTPSAGAELQSEYMVDAADAPAALLALDRVRDRIAPVLQTCEIRTVAADGLWLSPCHGRRTACLHFTWIADAAAVLPVVALVESALAPFAPRPHWGKVFTLDPETVRSRYPRLPDFRRLRARLDPTGTFGNDFTDRYL